jgi:hypothetical protein
MVKNRFLCVAGQSSSTWASVCAELEDEVKGNPRVYGAGDTSAVFQYSWHL